MAVQYAFGKIVTQGLDLNVDAADPTSYPGSGTSWTNVVNRSITGSVISCSFSSDFKGGIVFNNPSASVVFPGTVANYGTGSFTVEMAFRPSSIEGIHYLVSKNSGSYPNWGVYLSGSGGSGKLWAEYNIDATVSCSVSSSSTFETGSNYFVDVNFIPSNTFLSLALSVNGIYDSIKNSNGTGSLSTTSSLFFGNPASSSSQAFAGSTFNIKTYSFELSNFKNFAAQKSRYNLDQVGVGVKVLVVAGGGAGGNLGGGGAGGVRYGVFPLTAGVYDVYVGKGGDTPTSSTGSSGENSYFDNFIAYGGGGGGGYSGTSIPSIRDGRPGGSGGGAGNAGGAGVGGTGNTPSFSPPQGYNGGSCNFTSAGAGGGGASQNGSNAASSVGGKGGDGLLFDITGVSTYYGGGGGGPGASFSGSGGLGGGGNGSISSPNATPGSPNTGGGGGGTYGGTNSKGYGGSGIVIIRYPGNPIATGGTITSVDGDIIHTFTATGSHTFTVL